MFFYESFYRMCSRLLKRLSWYISKHMVQQEPETEGKEVIPFENSVENLYCLILISRVRFQVFFYYIWAQFFNHLKPSAFWKLKLIRKFQPLPLNCIKFSKAAMVIWIEMTHPYFEKFEKAPWAALILKKSPHHLSLRYAGKLLSILLKGSLIEKLLLSNFFFFRLYVS